MPRGIFAKTVRLVGSAVAVAVLLSGCGGGGSPTTLESAAPTTTPSGEPTTTEPPTQKVPVYSEKGTLKYVKFVVDGTPGGSGKALVCDDKSTVSRELSTAGTISINGALVNIESYTLPSENKLDPAIPMMDIIYPRTLPVRAVIINKSAMGLVNVPKGTISLVRLVLIVPTFSQMPASSVVVCVAKPAPKPKPQATPKKKTTKKKK